MTEHLEELRALVEQATAGPTFTGTCDAGPEPIEVTEEPMGPAPQGNPVNRDKPELPAYVLAIIAIICIAALTFHGDKVPDILNLVTIGALGIGGAVTQVGPKSGG